MGIPDIPEKELLARCISGDKEAWDFFVIRYSKHVYHFLYQIFKHKNPAGRPDEIDDLHQDIFCSLMANGYTKLSQFKGKNGCSLASWLRVITVRRAFDDLRKTRAARPVLEHSDSVENRILDSKDEPDAEEDLIRSEERAILAEAIGQLHPRHQLFVELFYRRGLSIEEISRIMRLAPNGVYQLHHRVKEKLREILHAEYPEMAAYELRVCRVYTIRESI